jgi:uncharacterized Zn-binding protein involved in type VI secretion
MGNVVRIGDSVSCGDHAAQGSSNVYMDGMPVVTESRKTTTGHGCNHPTVFIGPWSETVFVNNARVAIKGKTKIKKHGCSHPTHDGVASSSGNTVSIED